MASYNRVILVGNLTADPELNTAPSGNQVCEIRMAVNNRYKNASGEWIEKPMYIDVSVWGNQAPPCKQYLSKGSPVLVEGKLRYDTWEKEGQKRSKHSITADRVQFLSSPRQDQMGASGAPSAPPKANPAPAKPAASTQPAPPPPSSDAFDDEKDDLPF